MVNGATGLKNLRTATVLVEFAAFAAGADESISLPAAIPNLRCLLTAIASSHLSLNSLTLVLAGFSILLILWSATKPANFALAILVACLSATTGS